MFLLAHVVARVVAHLAAYVVGGMKSHEFKIPHHFTFTTSIKKSSWGIFVFFQFNFFIFSNNHYRF